MKNQKGITLVALVVTIIVLLILAGVSLNLVSGSNGILTRATSAAQTNEVGAAKEKAELFIAEATTAYYEAKYVNVPRTSATSALAYLVSAEYADTDDNATFSSNTLTVTYAGYTLTITSAGALTIAGGSLTSNVGAELGSNLAITWNS